MEGKCVLFKEFGGVDAFPLCVRSKSVDDIVKVVSLIAGSFGGINLEDISAPRCFEIERKLKEICDIPIFHDDQHGTAVVTVAATINALKLVNKKPEDVRVVVNGAGAAGIACSRLMLSLGIKDIIVINSKGIVYDGKEGLNSELQLFAPLTNPRMIKGGLKEALVGADIFLGVSVPGIVTEEMVKSMNRDPIIFACANPVPEIMPDLAKSAGAKVVGTGRSDFPNQINNVLAFPGIFRGTFEVRASDINDAMKIAAANAIADLIEEKDLNPDYIIPAPFDSRVADAVSAARLATACVVVADDEDDDACCCCCLCCLCALPLVFVRVCFTLIHASV
jgi:malate dehydrogenase (oxaloacetate-decarboxylating)